MDASEVKRLRALEAENARLKRIVADQMLALASAIDPALDDTARMEAMLEDLMPLLGDMQHGSDVLVEILEFGANGTLVLDCAKRRHKLGLPDRVPAALYPFTPPAIGPIAAVAH